MTAELQRSLFPLFHPDAGQTCKTEAREKSLQDNGAILQVQSNQ